MKIAFPVTDYIRESMLTNDGDIIANFAGVVQRYAKPARPCFLSGDVTANHPFWRYLDVAAGQYYKSTGLGLFPGFTPLALRDTGIHINQSTRNAGGAQVIAGVGFESSVIAFLAIDDTTANMNWSIGYDNNDAHLCIGSMISLTDMILSNSESIIIYRDGANSLVGHVTAISATGFTITWTLVGVCAADFIYLCLP